MTNNKVSSENSSGRRTLLAGLIAMGAFGVVQKAKAAQQLRAVGAPMIARAGERFSVEILNDAGVPVVAILAIRNAHDGTLISSSTPINLPPGTGNYHTIQMTVDSFVAPALACSAPRDFASGQASGLKASAQLFNPAGETVAYQTIQFD